MADTKHTKKHSGMSITPALPKKRSVDSTNTTSIEHTITTDDGKQNQAIPASNQNARYETYPFEHTHSAILTHKYAAAPYLPKTSKTNVKNT